MPSDINLADIRKSYTLQELSEHHIATNPFLQFETWLKEAITAQAAEPTAMVLSTVNPAGKPSARVVLLKAMENESFIFYTNYQSRKGSEVAANPFVALTFFWPELERQVRIEGRVEQVNPETSDVYFQSRPRGSQIGALVSPQSKVLENRQLLEKLTEEYTLKYGEHLPIPRPAHWGGYKVIPSAIEFWQGRANRLHDRLYFQREVSPGPWQLSRLAP